MGYQPVEVENILASRDFVAKTPEENILDMQNLFKDNSIKALWAARGGYGSNYLLPLLPGLNIGQPRIILGSSDVSYLLWYFLDKLGTVVFYAPMIFSSVAKQKADLENFNSVLSGAYTDLRISGRVLKRGQVSSIVTGGCLSNFVSLLGTAFFPMVKERVLLLEDTNERPYQLDRMMWQLAQNNIFSKISALILGEFPNCFLTSAEKDSFLTRIKGYLDNRQIPILYDLPFGHAQNAKTLPLGVEIKIDTSDFAGIRIQEKGVL